MTLDALLSRRDFLKDSLKGAGALAVASSFPDVAVAQTKPRDIFRRGSPYNIESLPVFPLEQFRQKYMPSIDEQAIQIGKLQRELPILRERKGSLTDSYMAFGIRLEPDRNYANKLIEEAVKSIEHMFKFLQSDYLPRPSVTFRVLQTANEINFQETPSFLVYLVGDLIGRKAAVYKFEGIEEPFVFGSDSKPQGAFFSSSKLTPNSQIRYRSSPILYNASSDPIDNVEASAIEVLHKSLRPYTLKHVRDELKAGDATSGALERLDTKHVAKEEKFVHALSILWLRKYNADRNLGFSDAELNEKFAKYETENLYRGANQLARHISKIGVQKAIELYITNPDKLFSAAGI